MNARGFRVCVLVGTMSGIALSLAASATDSTAQPAKVATRDGQHDFDFNIGVWKTHIRRILDPLSGSANSIELEGTVTVRKVWDGRAQLEEIEADGPPDSHHFEESYSPDGGKTWAPAFIANLTRERP